MDLSKHDGFKAMEDEEVLLGAKDRNPMDMTQDAAELLQMVLESGDVGVWERDFATGMVHLSQRCRRILGLPDSHSGVMTQEEWLNTVDPRDKEQILQWGQTPDSLREPGLLEYRIKRPDGEIRWTRVGARILPDREGRLTRLVGLQFDDTDRRRAEEEVKASEALFRVVQESALIGSFVGSADGTAIGTRQFYRNLGLPDDTPFVDRGVILDTIHPVDRERVERETAKAKVSADSLDLDYRILRADTGELRWIFLRMKFERGEDGRPTRTIGAYLDITESRLAKEALQESQDQLSLIQEAALIGTYVTNAERKSVGSAQFYRNLGLPEDTEYIGRDVQMGLIHPDDRTRVIDEMANALLSPANNFDTKYRILRADTGELRWIFSRIKFERASDGGLIRIVGAHLDITGSEVAEAALRESEARCLLIQEAALIGTYVTDADQRTRGSRQFYRNLGLSEDSEYIDSEAYMDFVHPDDRKRVEREVMAAAQSADGVDFDYRINRADTGELRWIFSRIKFEREDDGKLIRMVGAHLDITETKRAEAALQESVALNQSMMEASADCVKLISLDGQLEFINEQGLAALEIEDSSRVLGKPWARLLPRAERHKVKAALDAARNGEIGRFNGGGPTMTGKSKWWDVVVTPIRDKQGQIQQFLAISRDITEHRENLAQIRWTASHDMLTGLPNRRYFQGRLEKLLARAAEQGSKVGLLQLDIDDFKQINDALGHDAGDALLKDFTQRLQKATRGTETVARLGGDEFAIIVPQLTGNRPLSVVVADIHAQLAEPFVYQGRVFDCRASIGKAIYPQHGDTADALLKNADIALYAAKTSGRGNVRRFNPEMRSDMHKRLDMVSQARTALRNDLIFPYYQPKIDFRTGAAAGFEALLRWQDPHMEIQPPAAIAAAFEDLDFAQTLSERMQLRVLADIRRWLDAGVNFGHVAINASAAEFRQNDFAERLLNRLRAVGVPSEYIELEVTETVFLGRGAEFVERALRLLSAEGMRIALDDFGTGFASLSHLKKFPVDIIKIDQSFVRNIEVGSDDSAIIKALIGLGNSLSIDVVAEGIENQAQSNFLADQGCDYGQGYLFSKAIAAADVPQFLVGWRRRNCSIVPIRIPETPKDGGKMKGSASADFMAYYG